MITGVGVDIIELVRIEGALKRWGNRFLSRVFTEREISYCQRRKDPVPSLAGRFAAKEAVGKALGLGTGRQIGWKEVEITNDPRGKPEVHLTGRAAAIAGGVKILISISHSRDAAVAFAIAGEDGNSSHK